MFLVKWDMQSGMDATCDKGEVSDNNTMEKWQTSELVKMNTASD